MPLTLIQRPNTLLQGQQTLINLRPINPCLLILIHMVGASLTPRQINKRYLPIYFLAVF
jgi:hypothetical protein